MSLLSLLTCQPLRILVISTACRHVFDFSISTCTWHPYQCVLLHNNLSISLRCHPWNLEHLTSGHIDGCHMWSRNCLPFRSTWLNPCFCGVRVVRCLVFNVMFCRSLFVPLYFFFWSLCCLSFDAWILITSLSYLQTFLIYPILFLF